MFSKLRHWFFPHHTNNYRAKLLHHSSLLVLIIITFFVAGLTRLFETSSAHILGLTAHITPQQVILKTNQERIEHGLSPLRYSPQLTLAAQRKANHMFVHNYWAHFSPSGKTPWDFILAAGYNYLYAGENLAKGFNSVNTLLQAWMNSPTHRANILSPKYHDIGVAVATGTLQGQDTVLVVQLFGSLSLPSSQSLSATTSAQHPSYPLIAHTTTSSYLLNLVAFKKTFAYFLIFLLMITLIIDLVMTRYYNFSRQVGDSLIHLIFINLLLLLFNFLSFGSIL